MVLPTCTGYLHQDSGRVTGELCAAEGGTSSAAGRPGAAGAEGGRPPTPIVVQRPCSTDPGVSSAAADAAGDKAEGRKSGDRRR